LFLLTGHKGGSRLEGNQCGDDLEENGMTRHGDYCEISVSN
jgi:hypothetical protein